MRDFTIKVYQELLQSLKSAGYTFITVSEAVKNRPEGPYIILRHDVDSRPGNSLEFAKIQHSEGIRTTYYFRAKSSSWNEDIIKNIDQLGHEIGYHYENLAVTRGDPKAAIEDFKTHLSRLRDLAPVNSICMHGSPLSRHDPKELWREYDYADFGIIAEPYFDLDFSKVLYLTDTGRRWNGHNVSMRDRSFHEKEPGSLDFSDWKRKPVKNSSLYFSNESVAFQRSWEFKNTMKILESLERNCFPEKSMFTFHPQRWTDNYSFWIRELLWQNIKNLFKMILATSRKKIRINF